MFVRKFRGSGNLVASVGIVALVFLALAGETRAQGLPGAVYAMTNNTAGNGIMAFTRAADGTLTAGGTFATGGLGFGTGNDPLGSQGSLILSGDGHLLFAVNAGSNDISVLAVQPNGLKVIDRRPSGGTEPVSVALYKNLLYVLNAGGTPNIFGFQLEPDGVLRPLPGSSRPLAGGTAASPAQVGFTPDGSFLVVTEKATNLIDTYRVLESGLTAGPISNASSGATPFGFTFGHAGALVVSEAAGGTDGTSATSSYQISTVSGELSVISSSVGDTQLGACWIVATNNGRFVFLSNTGSATLSSYTVGARGTLTLLNATAATTGSGTVPLDSAITFNGEFLYVLDEGTGGISGFRVGSNGSLAPVTSAGGLPVSSQGLAAQ